MRKTSNHRRIGRLAMVLFALALLSQTACLIPVGKEFREAAGTQLEDGVNMVVDGLLDGIFAVIEPDSTSDSTS